MPNVVKAQAKYLESHIKTILSDAEYDEYSRLCDSWRKNNARDDDRRTRRQDATRKLIRAFLEMHPKLLLLHNQLSVLQGPEGTNRRSPLPLFKDLDDDGGNEVMGISTEFGSQAGPSTVKNTCPGDTVGVVKEESVAERNSRADLNIANTRHKSAPACPIRKQTHHQPLSQYNMANHRQMNGRPSRPVAVKQPRRSTSLSPIQQPAPLPSSPVAERRASPPAKRTLINTFDPILKKFWNDDFSVYEIPIQNPNVFPTHLIVNLENATLTEMEEDRDENGAPTNFTARLQNHPYFDIIMLSQELAPFILVAIGVTKNTPGRLVLPFAPTPLLQEPLRLVCVEAMQAGSDVSRKRWPIAARLEVVRHPYLFWLEMRGVEETAVAPKTKEIKTLAKMLGRMEGDVRKNIVGRWELEHQERRGAWHRANRESELGGALRQANRAEQAREVQ